MKKTNFLSLFIVLSLAGCANGNDNPSPTTSSPQQAATPPTTTNSLGFYNSGNPFFNPTNNIGQVNTQAQFQWSLQVQAMSNAQARSNSRYFYYQNALTNNCAVRTQPTYTLTDCACALAPCDCPKTINELRLEKDVAEMNARNAGNITITTTTSANGTVTVKQTSHASTLFVSILNADARAIYERLEVTPEVNPDGFMGSIRTGKNVKCSMAKDGSDDADYVCDFDLVKADGSALQWSKPGTQGQSVVDAATPFSGSSLTIDQNGDGKLLLMGKASIDLFKKLSTATASIEPLFSDPSVQANVKTAKQVKCYQSIDRHPITECTLDFDVNSGTIAAPR